MFSMDTVVMMIVAAVCGQQWYVWRKTAINADRAYVALSEKSNGAGEIMDNLHQERQRNHDAIMGAFDYINDNCSPEDAGLMQVKNVLVYAIQNSTFGRE